MATEWILIAGIVFLLICILLTLSFLIFYSGVLTSVEVGAGPPPIKEAVVAYKFARGPYKNASSLFGEVVEHVPNNKCIGIYYDDPKVVPAEKLRFAVGAVLAEGKVKVEKEIEEKLILEGFKIIKLPEVSNVVKTTFPYRTSLSIFFAVMKVYPQMASYIAEKRLCAYPFLELYDADVIHFFAPLAKQEEFFVEEANDPEMQRIYNENQEACDDSFLDSSREGSASVRDTSCSKSLSTFSSQPFTDVSDAESTPDMETSATAQDHDEKIVASIELRRGNEGIDDAKRLSGLSNNSSDSLNLQDSGVCSGRTSSVFANSPDDEAVSEEQVVPEVAGEDRGSDSNVSTSSFEEIHMDESVTGIPRTEEQTSVRKE